MSGMYGIKDAGVKQPIALASLKELKDKVVTIVGGTSGAGRALALAAAKEGAEVWTVGRSNKVGPLL